MNDLEKYFRNNKGRLIRKWNHYFDIYDRHFGRFRGKKVVILEIGVWQGGSLQMWKDYFGSQAEIYGIDINPQCLELEEENIKILIGSQSDRHFLRSILKTIPPVDIVIDDGGHSMRQQIISQQELFSHVKDDGVYLCEDVHTSYWHYYGGGYRRFGTYIEFSKKLIDKLNAFHTREKRFKADSFTENVNSIHFYDSIVVFEKKKRIPPIEEQTGKISFERVRPPRTFSKMVHELRLIFIDAISFILKVFRLPDIK